MSEASFSAGAPVDLPGLGKHNPDILTCLANLSADEVFTPPKLAGAMLDILPQELFTDPTTTFLDPFTKSGVFLREIASRLNKGLATQMPDDQKRVDHILTKQVFGIATSELTWLLARRSLYCSKKADGRFSICTQFTTPHGNVRYTRTKHRWNSDGKCEHCGANRADYDRGEQLESYAFPFIHGIDPQEEFGVKFDVIIGNPPYQLGQSGGNAIGRFAMPIYQKFIDAAKKTEPRFLSMVTPSRWFAGGRGLDEFRKEMLADRSLRALVDYPDSRDVFAGVDIAGGISFFLWDSNWDGKCEVTTVTGGKPSRPMARYLNEFDILVRSNEAVSILERVLNTDDDTPFDSMASQVEPIQPFSIRTKFRGEPTSDGMSVPVLLFQNGGTGYIERDAVPRNVDWVDQWKVYLSGASSEHGGQPDKNGMRRVFSRVFIGGPGTACTETYLVTGRYESEAEAVNLDLYLRTKFVRYLVSLRTNTQHLYSERFAFVPRLPMDRSWSDEELYARYGLSDREITWIESRIRPMD